MPLKGQQVGRLVDAFLAAFSSSDLEQLVRFELNENLDDIVPGGSLRKVVFELIEWAENQGRVHELVQAALKARPNNQEFLRLAQEIAAAT